MSKVDLYLPKSLLAKLAKLLCELMMGRRRCLCRKPAACFGFTCLLEDSVRLVVFELLGGTGLGGQGGIEAPRGREGEVQGARRSRGAWKELGGAREI